MAKKKEQKLRVTQIRSTIGQLPAHRKTIVALGLRKLGQSREMIDTPQLRGMLEKVKHIVTWEEVK
jgi:large subunit ribosomal protein L30